MKVMTLHIQTRCIKCLTLSVFDVLKIKMIRNSPSSYGDEISNNITKIVILDVQVQMVSDDNFLIFSNSVMRLRRLLGVSTYYVWGVDPKCVLLCRSSEYKESLCPLSMKVETNNFS